jgi:hypothetical protein
MKYAFLRVLGGRPGRIDLLMITIFEVSQNRRFLTLHLANSDSRIQSISNHSTADEDLFVSSENELFLRHGRRMMTQLGRGF